MRWTKYGVAHLFAKTREATIYDRGRRIFSATTRATLGKTVTSVLHHAEETKDKMGLCISRILPRHPMLL